MYAYIIGKIEEINEGQVVIDNNDIGYLIHMSDISINKILSKNQKEKIKIYTYQRVQEDDISLYGFAGKEEKRLFERLITVSKIGAKTAMGMLSKASAEDIAMAVITSDKKFLSTLPGIGPKSASRIILELQDKLTKDYENMEIPEFSSDNSNINKNNLTDAEDALKILGFYQKEISEVLPQASKKANNTEDIIKEALKLLSN